MTTTVVRKHLRKKKNGATVVRQHSRKGSAAYLVKGGGFVGLRSARKGEGSDLAKDYLKNRAIKPSTKGEIGKMRQALKAATTIYGPGGNRTNSRSFKYSHNKAGYLKKSRSKA